MARPEWRDVAKEKRWRRMLELWGRSGLSVRQFCARHKLSEPSLYAWRREIARRDQEKTPPQKRQRRPARVGAFMLVSVAAEAAAPRTIEVVMSSGRLLRVGAGFDVELLRQLVRLLEEPSC